MFNRTTLNIETLFQKYVIVRVKNELFFCRNWGD